MKKHKTHIKLTITLPKELLEEFKHYCKEHGMHKSTRIAVLINKDIQPRQTTEHSKEKHPLREYAL
jgi:metal-responsive CopG/Arc/MetJ family transcriptional regulator